MNKRLCLLLGLVVLGITACEQKKPETPATTEPPSDLRAGDHYGSQPPQDPYLPHAGQNPPAQDPSRAAAKPAEPPPPDDVIKPVGKEPKKEKKDSKKESGRTHTVQKGDTLTSIAKKYYGDANRWKDIYNANKTRIKDKDKLTIGTKLIIP